MTDDTDTVTARVQVIAGGEATAQELAALVVALTPVAVHEEDDEVARAHAGPAAWTRAALLEGTGRVARVRSPAELRAR